MIKAIIITIAYLFLTHGVHAQHDHKQHTGSKKEERHPANKVLVEDEEMTDNEDTVMNELHKEHSMNSMSHAFSLSLPMNRNGSGTGWLPDASPMYGKMYHRRNWMFMLHGNAFLRYSKQDIFEEGSRGSDKVDIPNWIMGMAQRRIGRNGLLHFNLMMSLDAPIAGGEGYPLLFQSGETWNDQPLVDRQHPHDLFSELSLSYAHAFSKKTDLFVYIGYPGEPALGPVAFMHRPSAMPNPDATLSHHWTDATHITFGVATLGLRYGKFKLEGSSFTGREPGENRYNFDKPRFDSRSARLSFNPDRHWATQISHAFINNPEPLHAGEDVYRTTASAIYSNKLHNNHLINATALWGMNKVKAAKAEHSLLLEASYAANRLMTYTRYEWVQKSSEELHLDESIFGHHELYPVHALTFGAAYDILYIGKIRFAAGTQFAFYKPDERLEPLYGSEPVGGQIYLRIYPGLM